MNAVMITDLKPVHVDQCIELWAEAGLAREHDFKDRVIDLIERGDHLCKVALLNDAPVGCVLGSYNGFRAYLFRIVVHNEHRQKGIGARLLSACEKSAREIGATSVALHAEAMTEHWCERLGYYPTSSSVMLKLLG